MPTRVHAALAAAVLMVLATLAATLPATTATAQVSERKAFSARATSTDDFEMRTMVEINRVRAENGLWPIKRVLPCLDTLSEAWGARMVGGGFGGCVLALPKPGREEALIREVARGVDLASLPPLKHYRFGTADGAFIR